MTNKYSQTPKNIHESIDRWGYSKDMHDVVNGCLRMGISPTIIPIVRKKHMELIKDHLIAAINAKSRLKVQSLLQGAATMEFEDFAKTVKPLKKVAVCPCCGHKLSEEHSNWCNSQI